MTWCSVGGSYCALLAVEEKVVTEKGHQKREKTQKRKERVEKNIQWGGGRVGKEESQQETKWNSWCNGV